MLKRLSFDKFVLVVLMGLFLTGCALIVKDDNQVKYYGIDEKNGSDFLNNLLQKQEEFYQSQKTVKVDK